MKRLATLAATLLLGATAASAAGPKIEECFIGMRATEGASAVTHSDRHGTHHIELTLFGELGSIAVGITPLAAGDAVLVYRRFAYSHPIYVERPIEIRLETAGRAMVRSGRICAEQGCFVNTVAAGPEMAVEDLQAIYDEFLREYPARQDCNVRYSG